MDILEAQELRRQIWDSMSEECYDCPLYCGTMSHSEIGDQVVSETLYECGAEFDPFKCPIVRRSARVSVA